MVSLKRLTVCKLFIELARDMHRFVRQYMQRPQLSIARRLRIL